MNFLKNSYLGYLAEDELRYKKNLGAFAFLGLFCLIILLADFYARDISLFDYKIGVVRSIKMDTI